MCAVSADIVHVCWNPVIRSTSKTAHKQRSHTRYQQILNDDAITNATGMFATDRMTFALRESRRENLFAEVPTASTSKFPASSILKPLFRVYLLLTELMCICTAVLGALTDCSAAVR